MSVNISTCININIYIYLRDVFIFTTPAVRPLTVLAVVVSCCASFGVSVVYISKGGYSNVYRVVEEGSNNVFALKRMLVSADEMDLVKREVSLMVRLQLLCVLATAWSLALYIHLGAWPLARLCNTTTTPTEKHTSPPQSGAFRVCQCDNQRGAAKRRRPHGGQHHHGIRRW